MSSLTYRPDIDGLRAVAVLCVVLFHAGLEYLSGGYTGVDVFFVISGYLITSIIIKEIRRGDFSLTVFYVRRIRRILPAFFVVAVFSSIAAYLLFLPQEFEAYGRSLIAAALSVSNIYFWSESGYFDSSSDLKPLLHTWSLGVEEQFYIIFPLYLMLVARFGKQQWIYWILPVAIISFAASVWETNDQAEAAFYLAHLRAWELALGAIIALGVLPNLHNHYLREISSLTGLALIAWGVATLNSESIFPGLNALYPCLGAALIIHAGSSGNTLVGRLLSWRPLVLIGLISYSLYLWHWPLLAFAKYYSVEPLTLAQITTVLLLSLLAAGLSWQYVERPFRKRRHVLKNTTVFATGAITTIFALAVGVSIIRTAGAPERIPESVQKLANGARDTNTAIRQCMNSNKTWSRDLNLCRIGATNGEPSFIVLGDSHAGALMPGVDLAAKRYAITGLNAATQSCPPLDGVKHRRGKVGEQCIQFRDGVLSMIETTSSLRDVILIARWPAYSEGSRYGNDDTGNTPILLDLASRATGNHAVFALGLERTVARLRKAHKSVHIVLSVPEVGWNVPGVLARNQWTGRDMDIRPTIDDFHARNKFILKTGKDLAERYNVNLIYPHKMLCDSDQCSVSINGTTLYSDDDHLSVFGANYISEIYASVFDHQRLQ